MGGRAFYQSAKGQPHAVDTGVSSHLRRLLVCGHLLFTPHPRVIRPKPRLRNQSSLRSDGAQTVSLRRALYGTRDCTRPLAAELSVGVLPVVGIDNR